MREGPAKAHGRAWRLAIHVARDQTMQHKNAQSTAEVSYGNHDSVVIPIGFTQGFVTTDNCNCLVHSVYQHESGDRCRRENRVKQEAACQRIRLKKKYDGDTEWWHVASTKAADSKYWFRRPDMLLLAYTNR